MTLLIVVFTFAATAVICNFFEWFVHGKLMHGGWCASFLRNYFQKTHKEMHHGDYPAKSYQNFDHGPNVNLPWWAGIIVVAAMTFPGFLISYFSGHWEIAWCACITSASYFLAYNYVHTCFHVPNGRWFEKTKLYQRMDRYHHVHHARDEEFEKLINICVLCPLADWVMGTLSRSTKTK